jgi:hypothetical protein
MDLIEEQKAEIWRNDALRKAERAATFAHIREQAVSIEKERLREARSWGGPTMYTPLTMGELLDQIERTDNAPVE